MCVRYTGFIVRQLTTNFIHYRIGTTVYAHSPPQSKIQPISDVILENKILSRSSRLLHQRDMAHSDSPDLNGPYRVSARHRAVPYDLADTCGLMRIYRASASVAYVRIHVM